MGVGSRVERAEAPVSPRGSAPRLFNVRRCLAIVSHKIGRLGHRESYDEKGSMCCIMLYLLTSFIGHGGSDTVSKSMESNH